ncbi:MAG TPA: HAMP domain-containing sensor histidine kinase [Solirubrobacteraceae bacterium]|nr:HAMP domain-containing sensor histidine kinase [Solirubrobacteraceae bacterium]
MALKRRVGLAAAAAVGVAVVLVAGVSYFVVRGQLRGQIDKSLRAEATAVLATRNLGALQANLEIPPSAGGPAPYAQLVYANGGTRPIAGDLTLPVVSETVHAASNPNSSPFMSDVTVGGSDLRELTVPVQFLNGQTAAIELARPLGSTDNVLSNLRLVLLALCVLGVGLAAVLGRFAARRVLKPLSEVADTAQTIGETDDLSLRLQIHADDEVGQLARNFNAMLARLEGSRAALDESVRAQRQLVADASHELRTPVTSLRTNIEVLLAGGELGEEDRRRLLADVVEQSEELTALVGDLIELARGDEPYSDADDVRLDRVVEECVARARRNAPSVSFEAQLEPMLVEGVPERLERAVNNLLDNAARHSPPGGVVEVTVDRLGVRVRDHGTGVEPEDLPYVFDRFFRGASSRGSQGSGLGLAIVRQVAEQHGGTASAANAPDGGAVFTIELPTSAAIDPTPEAIPSPASGSLF